MTTPNPTPGFAPAVVDSTQWNSQVQEANARAMQDAAAYRAQDPSQTGLFPDFIEKPVEWVGSKLHSVYTNVVSRPITTALLAGYIGAADAKDNGQAWSNLFNSNIWDQAYKDSSKVSPGQALTFGLENIFKGSSNDDLKKAMQEPVMFKTQNELGMPTGQEVNLNQNGYVWDNPQAVAERFDTGAEKWVSGGLDAGFSWFLDPSARAGEALGVARRLAYVRPATYTPETTFTGMATAALTGGRLGGRPDTVVNISKNLQSSAFTQLGDLIMKQKDKLGSGATSGGTFESWVTNQAWGKNAIDTPALAAQLGKAADRNEVDQILGIAMGSQSNFTTATGNVVQGLQALKDKNAELGSMASMLEDQKSGLISNFPANPTPAQSLAQQQQLANISQNISSIAAQQSDLSDKIGLSMAMKNGMYFNPTLSPIASNIGDWARNLQTIKAPNKALIPLTLAYNNLYVRPVRVATGVTWGQVRAPGHIDIFSDTSHTALNASLEESKVWNPQERAHLVSRFISADANQKGLILDGIDRATSGRIAQKYGLTDSQADTVYTSITGQKAQAMDGRIYSTAMIDLPNGGQIRADHVDDAGNVVAVHPILSTQLENTHIMTDYENLNKVLKYNSGAFQKILKDQEIQARAAQMGPLTLSQMQTLTSDAATQAAKGLGNKAYRVGQFTGELGNAFNKMWKFTTLLRLNHGMRSVADDFMGQVARLGAWNVFMDRGLQGTSSMFYRTMAKTFSGNDTLFQQSIASLESGIKATEGDVSDYSAALEDLNNKMYTASQSGAGPTVMMQHNLGVSDMQNKLSDAQDTLNQLRIQRNKIGAVRDSLGDRYAITPDGQAFPKPFEGPQGQVFRDLNSDRSTIDSLLGGTAGDIWNRYRNTGDWRVITSTNSTEKAHLGAWLRVVQNQLMNDKAAQIAIRGGTAQDIERWFGTTEGRAYFNGMGLKNIGRDDLADRIAATVDHILPTHTPEAMGLRQGVMDGADTKQLQQLMQNVNLIDRPSVQTEGVAYAMGKSDVIKHMDGVISKFYDVLQRTPAEVLSRNPLFFSLYRQHINDLWLAAQDQGVTHLTPSMQQSITEQGRKLALSDVKRFTYNMDFESKLAHNMRFVAPFWGPMQEAFTRWGRIIADKPGIVAHAADVFNVPIHAGHAVDSKGNPVDEDGYAIDPLTGKKTLVAKADMHLRFQVPTWALKGLGVDGGTAIDMPINTLNLVLQNDPWYNPGMGPWVQVPANYAALRSNATLGDTFEKLGIIQQVKQQSLAQLGSPPFPTLVSTLLNQGDTDQQQKDMLQIMQAEDYKYKTGMRATEPTWQEVKDKAETGAMLRAAFKVFNFSGVSANFTNPYEFFRQRYDELQKSNPANADQVFLAKYGDAAFSFSGALSKSQKGLPATAGAVMADKRFSYLTDQYPELAQLIVGPYSAGEYSDTAYQQQVASGDRVKLTAQQSMDKARENLGWAQFTKYMNIVTANLYQAGFKDFKQPGAQKFDNERKAIVQMLTAPTLPDGQKNPYYNEQFSQQYNTVDRTKYDRQAAVLNQLVTEKALINDPMRSDIRELQQYMLNRNSVNSVLSARKKAGGSSDLNSNKNLDLKQQFYDSIQSQIEGNTLFQALHDRFLVRDMGFDHYDPALAQQQPEG